jgi:ubiquinone/menaquinone biosynthesis C-methylase UbiE
MQDYEAETYGDRIAEVYDELNPAPADITEAAKFVVAHAAGGRVLELGVGTGQLALAVAAHGVRVCGLDASAAMLAQLGTKPGAEGVVRVLGDMTALPVIGPFEVMAVIRNTLANLGSAEGQQRCLHSAAGCLSPSGMLVVEGYIRPVPAGNQMIRVSHVGMDKVVLRAATYNPDTGVVNGSIIMLQPNGIRMYPVIARDFDIDELDAMAAAAGLARVELWSDWNCSRYRAEDTRYVAGYRRS